MTRFFLIFLLLASSVMAQLTPVAAVSVSRTGSTGTATYYYWVIAKYAAGNANPAGPATTANAADVLSVSNYNTVAWNLAPSATGYDVLRTTTPYLPISGTCTCAVATGLSSSTGTYADQGGALSSYTIASSSGGGTSGGGTGANCTTTTIAYGSLTAAATTQSISLSGSIPASATVVLVRVKEQTQFTSGAVSALTVSVGRTGANTDYSPAVALMQAVSNTNFYHDGGALGTSVAAVTPTATFSSTGGNVNAMTAGSVDIKVCYQP